MSFDAFTITGILAAILSGGFLIGLVSRNDTRGRHFERNGEPETATAESRS
ncbi:hypothetical protein [uncultured Lamprocystis sp.]|jgi:hypothetical protein|uniref:hypothetical protein n=1 Tax=uncultured Lamprocystis sp. TaxID=543132 RepID=UPI0025CED948|nr:hypothetical protein [uncultured Lamprocystis sp.]